MTTMKTTEATTIGQIEAIFAELTPEDKVSVIRYGMYLLRLELQQHRVLAEGKVRHYEATYHTTLAALNAEGLPDDAGYEMHEDVIMWQHWHDVLQETTERIVFLEKFGVREPSNATAALLAIPGFEAAFRRAVQQAEDGQVVRFEDVRREG